MARYTGPKTKIARKFGEPIFGEDKSFEKRNYPPGQHGNNKRRGKKSEYAIQLMEKQKAKYTYGILERQFRNLFKKATASKGITGEVLLQFSHPASLRPYIMEKGSIALDGISLTVFNCKDDKLNVSIIPFTWSHTNLSTRKIGDLINIECDMIGKYVYKACTTLMNRDATGPVLDLLRQQEKE